MLKITSRVDSEYRPSQELLAAFADLPVELFNPSNANVVDHLPESIPVRRERHVSRQSVAVKEEQIDLHGDILSVFALGFERLTTSSRVDSEYHPSEELLAAFTDLPAEIFNLSRATTLSVGIKVEGEEQTGKLQESLSVETPSTDHTSLGSPLRSHRERSATMLTEAEENGHGLKSESTRMRIKLEPQDKSLSLPLSETPENRRRDRYKSMTLASNEGDVAPSAGVRIKAETQDDHRIPSLPRTPDPRLIGRRIEEKPGLSQITLGRAQLPVSRAAVQVGDPRLGRDRRTTQVPYNVHVKNEPRDDEAMPPPPPIRDPRLLRREQMHLKRVVDNGIDGVEAWRTKKIKSED
ncbi:hypothetical protein C0992_009564 [Termitomyces sp. T32_za158]|nr:hypothetical protein C0992_009564 [Termitomyces sp. T32_za158]